MHALLVDAFVYVHAAAVVAAAVNAAVAHHHQNHHVLLADLSLLLYI